MMEICLPIHSKAVARKIH